MAVEVAKLAAKPVKVQQVSKAPAPITPISGGGTVNNSAPSPKDDAAYQAWITKELAKRR